MKEGKGAALEKAAGPVSRETFEKMLAFEAEFLKWAARINLAAPSTLESLWERHILDSAQLLALGRHAKKWVDLGSGGGFPGAVLAILLSQRAGAEIHLVESNRKKAAFLKTILGSLGAPAQIHSCRIEDAPSRVGEVEIVTARALAPLPLLLDLAFPWLTQDARALFHKGRDYGREIEQSRDAWRFDLVEHRSVVAEDGVILEISGLKRG